MLDPCTTALAPGVADRRTACPYKGMAKYRHPVAISCHPNLRRTMSGNDNLASLAIQMFFEDQGAGVLSSLVWIRRLTWLYFFTCVKDLARKLMRYIHGYVQRSLSHASASRRSILATRFPYSPL